MADSPLLFMALCPAGSFQHPLTIQTAYYAHNVQHIVGLEKQIVHAAEEQVSVVKQHLAALRQQARFQNSLILVGIERNLGCDAQLLAHSLRDTERLYVVQDIDAAPGIVWTPEKQSVGQSMAESLVEVEQIQLDSELVCASGDKTEVLAAWWKEYHDLLRGKSSAGKGDLLQTLLLNGWMAYSVQWHTLRVPEQFLAKE